MRRLDRSADSLIRTLHAAGRTYRQIASEIGISPMGAWKAVKRLTAEKPWWQQYPVERDWPSFLPPLLFDHERLCGILANPETWCSSEIEKTYAATAAEASRWLRKATVLAGKPVMLLWSGEELNAKTARFVSYRIGGAPVLCGASRCSIVEVGGKDAKAFYDEHHLQGGCRSETCLGLEYAGKLVACMSFTTNEACRAVGGVKILQRFASAGNVPGAASRLLKSYRQKYFSGPIVSYSDNRYASGGLYSTLGFELKQDGKPDYRYWKDGRWFAKNTRQRKHLEEEIGKHNVLPEDTEQTLADRLGYKRCYDFGKRTWLLT